MKICLSLAESAWPAFSPPPGSSSSSLLCFVLCLICNAFIALALLLHLFVLRGVPVVPMLLVLVFCCIASLGFTMVCVASIASALRWLAVCLFVLLCFTLILICLPCIALCDCALLSIMSVFRAALCCMTLLLIGSLSCVCFALE